MSKKLLFLISFVLVLVLAGSTSAAVKLYTRVCWWSDDGPGHEWNEPNNWYTMDRYWDDIDDDNSVDGGANFEPRWYVKVHPNQVPDANVLVLVGKGIAGWDYPTYLHNNPPPFDPNITSGTAVSAGIFVGGGYSLDPNISGGGSQGAVYGTPNDSWWDPCTYHELTINGGMLNVGEPQTWEGFDTGYGYSGYFNGIWSGSSIYLGTCGWFSSELGPGNGQGTMNMGSGTVNVGGQIGVGGWEQTIATLNMSGGTINITQGLCCPLYPWGATGRVNLSGGTINARYLLMNNFYYSTGSIDIAGGKFILSRGDEVEELTDYSNGIGASGAATVSLTAYGVGDGEIITDSNYGAALGKRAHLSIDYDVSNDAKTTLQAFTTDPNQAWAPSPPDGATAVRGPASNIKRPVLSWSPGDGATSHEVYFDSNEALVDARDPCTLKQTTHDPCSWTVDIDLPSFGTYYWAIDENPGPTLGQVWTFTMANLSKASLPSPGNGEVDVNPVKDLSWVSGVDASSHDVYFGTNFGDVNDATKIPLFDPNNVFKGNQGPNTFEPDANGLEFGTTFYWRVDECNSGGIPLWPGDVWVFTTSDHIVVDDMDSYVDDAAMRNVWRDFYFDPGGTNRAELSVVGEPIRTGQSMLYYYRNFKIGGTYYHSWAEANAVDLEVGTDWTSSGVEALVLYFYGDPANGQEATKNYTIADDQMWLALKDGSSNEGIVKYPDMNDIKEASWHEWNIDLQDPCLSTVDMNNVAKVYIGFGGAKGGKYKTIGAGSTDLVGDTVWFDDIGLWPIRCVPAYSLSTDFTEDCVINEQDLELMVGDWLVTDYNSLGYMGTLRGFTTDVCDGNYGDCWVPGRIGTGALEFGVGHILTDPCCTSGCYGIHEPELDDDVLIPPLQLNTNTVTFTCWVRSHGPQWPDTALFHSDGANGEFDGDTVVGIDIATYGAAGLGYNWNNASATWNWDPIIPELPVNNWAFVALVVEPSDATMYIKPDGQPNLYSDSSGNSHDPEPFDIPGHIGSHKWRYFDGEIDDFRIYDYSLSLAEIQWLAYETAQGTEPDDVNHLYAHYEFDDGAGFIALDSEGTLVNWYPPPSPYNLVDTEPNGLRSVNFRDYRILANDWLKEPTWPPRP